MQKGTRLDIDLVARGLAESRARAQAIIMGGGITVDGIVVWRPAERVSSASRVELVRPPMPYVSRGGVKLRHALDRFEISADGLVALDVGASTGGFTDVLLQGGALKVYAVDVGYGQLAWSLRQDPRVTVMERTNIRDVSALPEPIDLAVIDVSFISLRIVLPVVYPLMRHTAQAIALIKPQFEAGKGRVGRGGVVRDRSVWLDTLRTVLTSAQAGGWKAKGLTRSPIKGPAGNVEFLAHLTVLNECECADLPVLIESVLDEPSQKDAILGH